MIDIEKFIISLRLNRHADGGLNPIRLADTVEEEAKIVEEAIKYSQRTWVGLTGEETVAIELGLRIPTGYRDAYDLSLQDFAKAIEVKLKERNHG
jgi:hypothetical protein